jgi:hypothetical protein
MKLEEYFITGKNGKSNCVIRSLCKLLNKEYEIVFNELCKTAEELNCQSFNDIPVFEKYMEDNNIFKITSKEDIKVKDLELDDGSYIVFCYDKKDFYHMIPIINKVIYDKNDECMDLFTISIYKKS